MKPRVMWLGESQRHLSMCALATILFAHLKRVLKLYRLRLRGMSGATDELSLAAAVQNLRRLAKLTC